jgi:hypothetical protein
VGSEGLGQRKIIITPSEIEPATFRLRYHAPQLSDQEPRNGDGILIFGLRVFNKEPLLEQASKIIFWSVHFKNLE